MPLFITPAVSYTNKGIWSDATTYTKDDLVYSLVSADQTKIYISKRNNNLNHILTDTAYWKEFANLYEDTLTLSGTLTFTDGSRGKYYNIDLSTLFTGIIESYSVVGTLPEGLSLNTSTGVLTGYAAEVGDFPIKIRAIREGGQLDSDEDTLTISNVVGSLEPSWVGTDLFQLSKDANGWSIHTPSATSRILYVSATGNDTLASTNNAGVYGVNSFADWKNPTNEIAFATFTAAYAFCRTGEDDFILFKRGDTFSLAARTDPVKGKSTTERHVIGDYGSNSLANPLINSRVTNETFRFFKGGNYYTSIINLNFNCIIQDPTSNEWPVGGLANITDASAILIYADNAANASHILIEGCRFNYFSRSINISTGDEPDNEYHEQIVIRRNIFDRNVANVVHAQAIFSSHAKLMLIEENIFYRGGWYSASISPKTIYRHACYFSTRHKKVLFRGNISIDPSSMHYKFTSNPTILHDPTNEYPDSSTYTITAALTGAAETQVKVSYIPVDTLQTGKIRINLNSVGTWRDVAYSSWAFTNGEYIYTLSAATDFSGNNASIGNLYSVDVLLVQDIIFYDNLMLQGQIGLSCGGNEHNGLGNRFKGIKARHNVFYGLGSIDETSNDIGWGIEVRDNDTSEFAHNLFLYTGHAGNTGQIYGIYAYGNALDTLIHHNQAFGTYAITFTKSGPVANQPGTEVYSNLINTTNTDYHDYTRTLQTYITSLNAGATIDDFITECLNQSKNNWRTAYTGYITSEYFRKGFTLTRQTPKIVTNPSNANVVDGSTATFTTSGIGAGQETYQWELDTGSGYGNITNATSKSYTTGTLTTGQTGNYRCKITDENGTATTTAGALTVYAPREFLTLDGTESYISYATGWGVDQDSTFEFNFRISGFNSGFTPFCLQSNTTKWIKIVSATQIQVRAQTTLTFNIQNLTIGEDHLFSFSRVAGVPTLTIDGIPYSEAAGLTSTTTLDLNLVGVTSDNAGNLTFKGVQARIWDIRIKNSQGTITKEHAVDAGSTNGLHGMTEAPNIGTGDITFVNTVAGDWTV